MSDIEPDSDDSSFQYPVLQLKTLVYFSFLLTIGLSGNLVSAQQLDSTKTRIFYEEVIRKSACGGSGLSEADFYRLLGTYFNWGGRERYSNSPTSSSTNSDNNNYYYYSRQDSRTLIENRSLDTIVRVVYIHDTIQQPTKPDTVFMPSGLPSSEDIVNAQEVLKKIIKDKEFADIIRATVAEMPAEELEKFQKELNQEFRGVKSELALEQAKRTVAELEAKKEKELARQKAKKEQKEKWKALSKDERKELIKARAKLLAYETAEGAGAVAAAAGGVVIGASALLAGGILAIGKGIIRSPLAIWNWIEKHFYVKIDLSCEAQQQIRAYRRVHNYKPSKIKKYKGFCPGW